MHTHTHGPVVLVLGFNIFCWCCCCRCCCCSLVRSPLHARKLKIQIILYFSLIREACCCPSDGFQLFTVFIPVHVADTLVRIFGRRRPQELHRNGEINYCDLFLIHISPVCFFVNDIRSFVWRHLKIQKQLERVL